MDRIFETGSVEDICTQAKKAIEDTKDCIENIKSIAAGVSSAASGIPYEARRGNLAGEAAFLGGKLEKDSYDTARTKLESCRERACSLIPEYDSQYAAQMQSVTDATRRIRGVIEELREFMLETALTMDCENFKEVLAAKETQWKKKLESAESLLDGAVRNAKGAQDISTVFSKDPVNLSTGNFIYDKEDLKIEGEPPFIFRRFYNSVNHFHGALGADWNHNYEVRLTFKRSDVLAGEEVTVLLEDGKEELFLPVEGGRYTPGNQSLAELWRTEEGYTYETIEGDSYRFGTDGRYLRHEDANGNGFTLIYEEPAPEAAPCKEAGEAGEERPGKLCGIRRDSGESFRLSYDKDGYLKSVADHTGRTFTYEVEGGRLIRAVRPDGGAFVYEYNGNGKLSGVTNPRGITTVENEYDEQHRTALQRFPDGTRMCYNYDDERRTVTMTERNGSTSIHYHDEKYRNIRNVYADGEERFEYNSRNQKTKLTDKLGNVTRLSYDNRGNLTGAVNPLGTKLAVTYGRHNKPVSVSVDGKQKVRNVYDSRGNLTESRDALGRTTGIHYNASGRPESICQADGSRIRLSYDERGNITELTDARGGTSRYTYDALNRVIETTDPKGNRTKFTYDAAGNILSVTNPAGEVRSYEYNESHKLTRITDFDGSTIQRTYNVLNKPEMITDQLGRRTKLQYDAMWNLARVTAPDGGKTTYYYNENNRLTRIKDALGNVTRYTYDGNGNRLSEEDAEGNITRFTYDAVGRLVKVTDADGAEAAYDYDTEGNLVKVTDALGNTVTAEYDEAGQLIKETNVLGESRSYTYTAMGEVESITDEAGRVTRYQYLPGGQVEKILYPDGTEESYTYDANGNVESYTNESGFTLSYTYDSLDRIIRAEGSGGEKKEYAYDAVGNVTAIIDALGNTTHYEYSPAGELTKVTDALGNETEYRYDPCGRLAEIRQYGEEGSLKDGPELSGMDGELLKAEQRNRRNRVCQRTRYQRDLLGRVEAITDALGQKESYRYNFKGQLIEKTDKEGYVTRYAYSHQGDVTHIRYEDGKEVSFTYNALRHLTEMEDWLGITRIRNDALGRAETVTYPDGREVSYTYGKTGERTSITYPDGRKIYYNFDQNLRLSELKDGDRTIRYAYDQAGRLAEKSFPGGMKSSYRYDCKGQIRELCHEDKEGILDRYLYRYDLMGNKTGITKERRGLEEESGEYTYGYDAAGRLNAVIKDGSILRRYSYDAFGNRTGLTEKGQETAYTYNALNQLLSKRDTEGETVYQYDRRGNLTEAIRNGAVRNQYLYGALNRLERAVNGKGETAVYQYNGLGYRVGKQEGRLKLQEPDPERTIRYTIDLTRGYHNLLEKEEDQRKQSYLWDGNAACFYEEGTGTPQYYLQDELGSPIRIGGEGGELTESYGYDEFGCDLYQNQGIIQPFGYTGYQYDKVTGTYFAQAREYIGYAGRFASSDLRAGFSDLPFSMNRYTYCFNNGMILVDLDGEWPSWEDIGKGINKVKESVSQTVDSAVKTVKKTAKEVKEKACDFYDKHSAVINGAVTIAGAVGIAALTVTTLGAGGVVTAAVVGASVGVSATATVDMLKGETSSIETYIGSAVGGAVGGILGTPAAIGKIGATLGMTGKFVKALGNPALIGAVSGGISTAVGEGLEALTGTYERPVSEVMRDIFIDTVIGGFLGLAGSKIKIQGINAGRNSYQAIFFSGVRKLVNGTGRMHLKTILKGFAAQVIDAIRDEVINRVFNEWKNKLAGCGEGD